MIPTTPTTIILNVYFPFGKKAPCLCCQRQTAFKLADRISVGLGGYYVNLRPVCKRCHKRITKAAAKAVKA